MKKNTGIRRFFNVFLTVCSLLIFSASAFPSQEAGSEVPAEDLTPEMREFLRASPEKDYRWTLIGLNNSAPEEEKLHSELNAIYRLWHSPLAEGRHAFRFEFTRPYVEGENVLHLYLKADGDENTGRKSEGNHQGVDYMFTLLGGDLNDAKLDVYCKDGKSERGPFITIFKDNFLYLSAEMDIQQVEGNSVFEFLVSSYVRGARGVRSGMRYHIAVSEGEPAFIDREILVNPKMATLNTEIPGWQLIGRDTSEVIVSADTEEDTIVIDGLLPNNGIFQRTTLAPGHYLFRALVKTNTFYAQLCAGEAWPYSNKIPIGVSEEFKWVELPFYVTGLDKKYESGFLVGLWHSSTSIARHKARIKIKKTELVRLGDTAIADEWVQKIPVHPLHNMELINSHPVWERPGKVVFEDSFIGTELWLMTQEGKVDHSYVGVPDFSHEGKYIYLGYRGRPSPGGLVRTDGWSRQFDRRFMGTWLFPWERKHLPEDTSPADWVAARRRLAENQVTLHNVVTGESISIEFPRIEGWRLIENPMDTSSRGPNIMDITHNTLVWHSDDRRYIGLSDTEGNNFRQYRIKTFSEKPAEDIVYPAGDTGNDSWPITGARGKAGTNWRNAVDREGNRYFVFEINRANPPNHPTNPYQVWALSMEENDERGLLRAVFKPNIEITDYIHERHYWWNFSAGLPQSGDNAILLLEDGTLLHMSALGMHSRFGHTASINCPYTGEVTFIGIHPMMDRITWPHEFRRDKGFATVEGFEEPACPIIMLDLENDTMWTAAISNFHDYAIRYRSRWDPEVYHKPMFRPSPTFSRDFTKILYFSSMLTGEHPDRLWADVYIAVVRYPQPPENVRVENNSLLWENPRYSMEIKGYNIYRSDESGRNFSRINGEPLTGKSYALPDERTGFYVMTSVEHSGLESRMFSNEVSVGDSSLFRHFYQPAEKGRLEGPMVPFFEPKGASNAYAVAITDPALIHGRELKKGLKGSVNIETVIPQNGEIRIMARVRGMSLLERTSYTTGWPETGETANGVFTVKVNNIETGTIPVNSGNWHWVEMDVGAVLIPEGLAEIEFSTSDAGIALDNIMITNDTDFVPAGADNTPLITPSVPESLKVEELETSDEASHLEWRGYNVKPPYVRFSWKASEAPQGVRHYNIYRGENSDFQTGQQSLLGSTHELFFIDTQLQGNTEYYYKVEAVDNWDNRSEPSGSLAVVID